MEKTDSPGLRCRPRKNGEPAWYWLAKAISRSADDYPIKLVRLHYATADQRAARCRQLTSELREWLANRGADTPFDGTLRSLIRIYQNLDTSPYHDCQENTRRDYDQRLNMLERSVGDQYIDQLNGGDFTRWHKDFKKPAKPGGPERIRQAHGLMVMVRLLLSFGVTMRLEGCAGTLAVIREMEFEAPAKRRQQVTFEQAASIVEGALAAGRRSIALGQALQCDLAMRQVDVIGKWTKKGDAAGGIVHKGKRWGGGLLWSDVSADLTVSKVTTKTAATGEWNLRDCPLVMIVLAAFAPEERVGPMVINEDTGKPYRDGLYSREWRPLATAAGVPVNVWNRDSRAGAITEAFESGATEGDTQSFATHADPTTTRGYRRATLESSTRVAAARIAGRKQRGNKA